MKRYLALFSPILFLAASMLGIGGAQADDPSSNVAEMQRTINMQAAEIKQLKRERDRLQSNVDQAWANVQRIDKEEAELKKIVMNLEKELRNCQGARR
jgi:peptidoglycan hydrolase CwlO-like protein